MMNNFSISRSTSSSAPTAKATSQSERSNPRINRILPEDAIAKILEMLLINKPVRILKTIARSGRGGCSVPWVYLENTITEKRSSTFISFAELLESFWAWLETIELMALSLFARSAVAEVVWQLVPVGSKLLHRSLGWCEAIEKERSDRLGLPRFWVELDDKIEKINPAEVLAFG